MVSPITKCRKSLFGAELYIKREDLLPVSFGGNKLRIAQEFLDDMHSQGADCIIGYGGLRSNLCRVLSNLATQQGIPCWIVCPVDDENVGPTANSFLTKLNGVKLRFCRKDNIARTVFRTMEECKAKGMRPYYIYGDMYGHGREDVPVRAYDKAYREIHQQARDMGISFDAIFLATGTGMTQAGLITGKWKNKGKERIIGVSVARSVKQVREAIRSYLGASTELRPDALFMKEAIEISERALCWPYGKYDDRILNTIDSVYCDEGIALDPIYTGKAFYGMCEELQSEDWTGKKVLFIHTGGTPLFFDAIERRNFGRTSIQLLEDLPANRAIVEEFLRENDAVFADPLTDRIDLKKYLEKIFQKGYNFIAVDAAGHICGYISGYANDLQSRIANESIFAVAAWARGSGIACELFEMQRKHCIAQGMKKLHLETNAKNAAAIHFYEKEKMKRCGPENAGKIEFEMLF